MPQPGQPAPPAHRAEQTSARAPRAPSADALLRDEQTLLAGIVERLRETTGMELASAWALRGEDEPYMVAAAFEGEPPATPDAAAWRTIASWRRATPAAPGSRVAAAFPGRSIVAAAPVTRGAASPLAVLCVASSHREIVRPRTLGLLDTAARRLAGPLAAARAARRLAEVDTRIRQLDRLAALGSLAAEVAHEVRNPLVSVKTFLQLLPERGQDPEFAQGFLGVATEELARVERLLELLIAHPRVHEGTGSADLVSAVEGIAELVRHLAQARAITVAVELSPDLPEVALDDDALRQVVLNLALNAVEACPEAGRVTLAAQRVEDGVELTVCDDGPGVPEAERECIFEPFHTSRGEGHGGLGLSITRRIVEEAGGGIGVDAPPGGGARFRVQLPCAGVGGKPA